MADRSIVVRLRADIADFRRSLAEASRATQDVGDRARDTASRSDTALGQMMQSARRHEQAWNDVGGSLVAIGAAAGAGVGLAVSKFADFDQALSGVQAATHETAGNMDLLREAALAAGADTAFSATEAANAVEELAKAGVSTQDVLGGGLSGALSLAAAGSLGVADAAEAAASAMTQFGLSGEDVPHIADLLAAAAGKAQGSVADMSAALGQAGLVANATGLSIEETTGGLAAFASAGLTGSDAGTSFKSMLQRLTPQSAEAQRAMDELGISAYDANGNFIGLAEFAGVLKSQMSDLTPEARNAAMAVIFGSDAVRASNVLYEEGAEGISEWTAAVDDAGFAAETAAIKTDNLRGDLERLGGSMDTAFIQSGSAANGVLREMTQAVTGAVDAFNRAPAEVQATALAATSAVAAIGLLGGGFMLLAPRVIATRAALNELATSAPRATAAMTSLTKVAGLAVGIAATAAATGALVDAMKGGDASLGANALTKAINDIVDSGDDIGNLGGQFANFGDVLGMSVNKAESMGDAFDQMLNPSVTDRISSFFGTIPFVTSYMENLEERAGEVDAALSAMVAAGDVDAVEAFRRKLEDQGYTIEQINELLPDTEDALIGAAEAEKEAAAETGAATVAIEEQVDALQQMIEARAEAAGVVLSERDAQRQLEQAYLDASKAVEENGKTLDITTEKGRANQSALDDIASAGWDVIESMQANGSTQEELQGVMATTRERFINAATSMGMSADEANRLADELNLIPTAVHTQVDVETAQAQANIDRLIAMNNGKRINLIVEATGSGASYVGATYRTATGAIARAEGGPVYGPGTATSDSIPAWLSNGEYVIKAAAVAQYGPAFFDSLNSQRFATGGLVGGSQSVAGATTNRGGDRTVNVKVENYGRDLSPTDIVRKLRAAEVMEPAW